MRYQASEAFDLDMEQEGGYAPRERAARPLVVVEGGHLDADARRGVSSAFVSRVRLVVVAIVVSCALGAARVAITAQTVSLMEGNLGLSQQVEEASSLNDELHAERSLLSSSSRIRRIATQSYGMVLGSSASRGTTGRAQDVASADVAQDVD